MFLILVLLLISFSPDLSNPLLNEYFSPSTAFFIGIGIYCLLLAIIFLQNRFFYKKGKRSTLLLTIVNIELLIFLSSYHFLLGASRIFSFISSDALIIVFSLLLYFGGLAVFYYSSSNPNSRSISPQKSVMNSELRLLIPFALPFVFITFFFDLLNLIPNSVQRFLFLKDLHPFAETAVMLILTLLFLIAIMVVLPFFIQKLWLCTPLENIELKNKLEILCKHAKFKHAGLKTWTVMNHALTAAIIGIVPRFRYILFTKRLLHELPPSSIEAILGHEIGHTYHKHLLRFPIIIFGLSIISGLLFLPINQAAQQLLQWMYDFYPSKNLGLLYPFLLFIPFAILAVLYFRLVFGLFSRLFEREADLYGFKLDLPAHHLINALNHIAIATGNSHRVPNWHHYSIQQRIDFLRAAEQNPKLIKQHYQKSKCIWYLYLFLLAIGCFYLIADNFYYF